MEIKLTVDYIQKTLELLSKRSCSKITIRLADDNELHIYKTREDLEKDSEE